MRAFIKSRGVWPKNGERRGGVFCDKAEIGFLPSVAIRALSYKQKPQNAFKCISGFKCQSDILPSSPEIELHSYKTAKRNMARKEQRMREDPPPCDSLVLLIRHVKYQEFQSFPWKRIE